MGGRGATAAKPRCRVCGKPLLGTMAMKLRRCDDCPSDVDVELLDHLKDWRRSTAKEQQVAAYIAQGLTNRQIAEALIVSERTIDAHVDHIRDKLGVRTRAAIAGPRMPAAPHAVNSTP